MKPVSKPDRSGEHRVRDIRPGDRIQFSDGAYTVMKIEFIDELIYFGKTARAMEITFFGRPSIKAPPGETVDLV